MGRRRAEQQRAASIGELRTLFDEIDADCSGELERHEIRSLVTRLGQDASEQDVDAAMAAMDKDGDGTVEKVRATQLPCAAPSCTNWEMREKRAFTDGVRRGRGAIAG